MQLLTNGWFRSETYTLAALIIFFNKNLFLLNKSFLMAWTGSGIDFLSDKRLSIPFKRLNRPHKRLIFQVNFY
jgi:hypothetical protein